MTQPVSDKVGTRTVEPTASQQFTTQAFTEPYCVLGTALYCGDMVMMITNIYIFFPIEACHESELARLKTQQLQ